MFLHLTDRIGVDPPLGFGVVALLFQAHAVPPRHRVRLSRRRARHALTRVFDYHYSPIPLISVDHNRWPLFLPALTVALLH